MMKALIVAPPAQAEQAGRYPASEYGACLLNCLHHGCQRISSDAPSPSGQGGRTGWGPEEKAGSKGASRRCTRQVNETLIRDIRPAGTQEN